MGGITMIASGNNHNLVLNRKGKVFGWGSNSYNQLTFTKGESTTTSKIPK